MMVTENKLANYQDVGSNESEGSTLIMNEELALPSVIQEFTCVSTRVSTAKIGQRGELFTPLTN